MGCLFGYFGKPEDGLLEKMADILSHRFQNGIERVRLETGVNRVAEIGHGRNFWQKQKGVFHFPDQQRILGFSGLLFPESSKSLSEKNASSDSIGADPKPWLTCLEGAFACALAQPDAFYLLRDPSGMKAIYWTKNKDRLVFASEIKALFCDPQTLKKLRLPALAEYLTFSYIPGENTMFEDIFELQPGAMLSLVKDRVSVSRYFEPERFENANNNGYPKRVYAEKLRDDLETAIKNCCEAVGEVPAVFLSGGIDSSSVLALAARRFPGKRLKTFSVYFGKRYANENEFISMMVDRYQTDHTFLEIKPKHFVRRLPEIIWRLDDPIGDPITVPNYLMAETASRHTGFILNGEGGDPCFGGPKNIPMLLSSMYGPMKPESNKGWMEYEYLYSYRKCFDDLENILRPEVLQKTGGREALAEIVSPFFQNDPPARFLNKLMSINIRLKGANLILVKVDKMTSANGIIALAPLFTRKIIQNAMECPPEMKLNGNVEKWVLKQAVSGLVPEPIIQRPKSGMMVPVRFWFQSEMKRYAKKRLSRKNLDRVGYFNSVYVQKLLRYDRKEIFSQRNGLKLWMLTTFLSWHEQMVENSHPNW